MENYIIKQLDNGLKICFINLDKKTDLIYLNMYFKIGSDNEIKNTLELSHLMEHLFAEFTSKKYNKNKELRTLLKQKGVFVNASVDENISKYDLKFNKKELKFILDVLSNAFYNFQINENIYKKEINAVKEELNQIINDNYINLEEKMYKILFKNHIREYTQKQHFLNLKNLSKKDNLDFFNNYYLSQNCLITITGNINIKTTTILLNKLFKKEKTNSKNLSIKPYISSFTGPQAIFDKKSLESSRLNIIIKCDFTYFDDNYYILKKISKLLTQDIDSILYKELRTKHGLIYSINFDLHIDKNDKNLSFINISTDIIEKNIVKTLIVILQNLKKLKKDIHKNEIQKLHSILETEKNEELLLNNISELIDIYSEFALYDKKIITTKLYYEKLKKISKQQIINLCKTLFIKENVLIGYTGNKTINKKLLLAVNKYL